MILKVHCPGCHTALQVPERSSGRFARCPACKTMFKVPAPTTLLEETVSSWIENDVESEFQARQNYWQQQIGSQLLQSHRKGANSSWDLSHQSSETKSSSQPEPPAPVLPTPVQDDELTEQELETLEKAFVPPPPPEPPIPAPPPVQSAIKPATVSTAAPQAPATEPVTPTETKESIPSITATPEAPPSHAPVVSFPNQLILPDGKPHLVVLECSQSGVTIAFDSSCLSHLGFRCSMPMADVFGGTSDQSQLYARPLAFIDRSGAAIRSAQEIETRYEQHILPGWTCKDLINAMGILEHLARPFCNPMPYYVDKHHRNLSIQCTTSTRADGGITAQVIIPRGEFALQWLERVNGVCGPEYDLLANELALIRSDAWTKLSEVVRQRINVWCQFVPREKFQLFLSDAEFGTHDAGLAGLVITDRRLIYHKYHHGGAISLHTQSSLLITRQEDLIHLTHVDAEKRTRLIKLSPVDLPALLKTLGRQRFLKIVNQAM